MFREIGPVAGAARGKGSDSALRHPDGSINFDAYREIARRARRAAIASSISGTIRIAGAALSSIGNALAGKAVPAARHHTP
jgi:hypothetical protein